MNILFVCTGNSCRSVMAEYILKKSLKDLKAGDIRVASAGTSALTGDTVSANAAALLNEYGINAAGHSSRNISKEIVGQAELIFALTRSHLNQIVGLFPEAKFRAMTLADNDISDPIGEGLEAYKKVFEEIRQAIEKNVLPKVL